MNRFQSIIDNLQPLNLWAFPIHFTGIDHLEKKPLVKWKPYQTERPSPANLEYWTRCFGWASAGIPTGRATNLLVVDCDSVEAADWYVSHGIVPTWIVRTLHGYHFYYDWPRIDIRNSASKLGPGVDVRGEGGCVVAPGSAYKMADGNWFTYHWCKGRSPADLSRAPAPAWLCEQLARKPVEIPFAPARPFSGSISPYARKAFDANINRLIDARNGTRNQTLVEVACRLGNLIAGGELREADVVKSVMAVAGRWDGEDVNKSRDSLMRALAYGKTQPCGR